MTIIEVIPFTIMPCLLKGILPATNALRPKRAAMLKMLDPIIMPAPTSCCPINKAVIADEISGVSAPNAAIIPSKAPDMLRRVFNFTRLPPRMKLKIVIKAKQIMNMNIADNIVIDFYAI